jgi:CubicO group peptidase (beta-lactamase class C family)
MEGEPGKTFHYGNAGLQIIAAILEKIANKDFETIFQERIAKPLQMNNTDFGKVPVPLAAGGAFSTPKDYLNFLQMILNEGMFNGKQVISKSSIIEMQKNRVAKDAKVVYSPAEAGNWGYGFGEWVMDNATENTRSKAVTSPGLFGTFPWVDNEKKYCAILFTFNIKSKGRNERYKELKKLVDDCFQ